jgi:multidrug efflux pump subunit AcrA (membrane-fusion protein)
METASTERRLAELDLLEAEMEKNLASLQLRQATALLRQRTIVSPIDGIVVARVLSPGEYVNEQAHILTVAGMVVLNVEAFVPIELFDQVTIGMVSEVRPESPVDGVFDAVITVVDQLFDPASSTFGVRLEMPNPDYILPAGLRCTVRFRVE